MSDQSLERALQRILARRRGDAPGSCPDENQLAAYLEGSLPSEETARFEEHASRCAACQGALALSMKLAETLTDAAGETVRRPRWLPYRYAPVRIALAATLVLAVGVILYRATRESQLQQPAAQIASQEHKGEISGGAAARPSATPEIAPAPSAAAEAQSKELSGPAKIPMPEKAGGQPVQRPAAPASIPAPSPILVLEAGAGAQPQVAAKSKAEAAKPAIGVAGEDLLKAQGAQPDIQALRLNMAAVRPDEAKIQAPVVSGQNADKGGRGGAPTLQVQTVFGRAQAQATAVAADRRAQRWEAEARSLGAAVEVGLGSALRIGTRIFWGTPAYWIEVECMLHGEAPAREITRASKEFADILAKEPTLAALPAGSAVMLYWNGSKLLIR